MAIHRFINVATDETIDIVLSRATFKSLYALRCVTLTTIFTIHLRRAATVAADASAKVIDGKLVAKQVREEIAVEVTKMKDATGIVPGLAVILVGSRKDSQTYVRNKKKACEAVGIKSYEVNLPEDSSEEEVIKHIATFNSDPSVHGILVQLPLPRVSLRLWLLYWLV
jgi:ABC-type Na+ transport system ATPase subunit NatA